MYYATFKGIKKGDIAEFNTKQERDNRVNFKDDFSVFVDNAPDNCVGVLHKSRRLKYCRLYFYQDIKFRVYSIFVLGKQ